MKKQEKHYEAAYTELVNRSSKLLAQNILKNGLLRDEAEKKKACDELIKAISAEARSLKIPVPNVK